MKGIRIENVGKEFYSLRRGKIQALKNINLEIDPGQFYVLLGPSGCGKSTLLNLIAGIEKLSTGEIRIGEKLVASSEKRLSLSPRQRDVAMVFQSYALYPHMTVFNNIAFPLKIARIGRDEILSRVKQVAGILEITPLLEARPGELSGGQRQRVALGRAIVRQPNLLLLDEPLSNLDALLRISMRSELKQIQRRLKVTTVYVTHDQTEAMSLGDRIAVLKDGEIQQNGTPEQIYRDPVNLFVARFVGTPPMNVADTGILKFAAGSLRLPDKFQKGQVTLGLRPEDLHPADPDKGMFRGTLNLIGSLGSEKLLYVHLEKFEILVKVSGEIHFREGEQIGLDIDEKNIFIFDKNTGKRIKN